MVGLEPTAAPDIPDSLLPGGPGELVDVKPGADPRLQGEGKLREVLQKESNVRSPFLVSSFIIQAKQKINWKEIL